MTAERFQKITNQFPSLRIAVVGDYSCDRYLEIDSSINETSIETGLPVHNVTHVRAQPGAAGTVLANLSALGVGELWPVGFCGCDGEGFELQRALEPLPGVNLNYFFESKAQRTFTYCKPLMMEPGRPPRELNRLDSKNWHPTPDALQQKLANAARALAERVDAMIVLDQVDEPETGVVTQSFLTVLDEIKTQTLVIGDSRRGLKNWPHIIYKINATELARFTEGEPQTAAAELAQKTGQPVFVSVAEKGIFGVAPDGEVIHSPALTLRGEIDIVGAGDAVTANLAAALASNAELPEALELANRAASIVIHKLGTTGTASVEEIDTWQVHA
ncbi:MAG: carbohydrate kinase [Verrucomicrobia subdivision 3 bacterium]|nr:carbohydrate kinase [Limisphaerales bacterium]